MNTYIETFYWTLARRVNSRIIHVVLDSMFSIKVMFIITDSNYKTRESIMSIKRDWENSLLCFYSSPIILKQNHNIYVSIQTIMYTAPFRVNKYMDSRSMVSNYFPLNIFSTFLLGVQKQFLKTIVTCMISTCIAMKGMCNSCANEFCVPFLPPAR